MIEQAIELKNMIRRNYGRKSGLLDKLAECIAYFLPSEPSVNGLPVAHSAKWYFKNGVMVFESGAFDSAITYWKHTVTLDPKCSNAYFNLGITYLLKEDIDKAKNYFHEVLKLDPHDSETKTLYNHFWYIIP
ncbi:MAG: tetratricopeptide repeat protein [bacterium]|nr:tetratricopeptide repeat protein [bacterium]